MREIEEFVEQLKKLGCTLSFAYLSFKQIFRRNDRMNFLEVIEELKKGKHVRRKSWCNRITIGGFPTICSYYNGEFDLFYEIGINDVVATDWEVCEEQEKTYYFGDIFYDKNSRKYLLLTFLKFETALIIIREEDLNNCNVGVVEGPTIKPEVPHRITETELRRMYSPYKDFNNLEKVNYKIKLSRW